MEESKQRTTKLDEYQPIFLNVNATSMRKFKQVASGEFHIVSLDGGMLTAREENKYEEVEIPLRKLYSRSGDTVPPSCLKPGMRLQIESGVYFILLDEIDHSLPAVSPFFQGVAQLSTAVSPSTFQELKDFLENKYAGVYMNNTPPHTTSIACYLQQCLLFEAIALRKNKSASVPLLNATGLLTQAESMNTTVQLRDPNFERTHADFLGYIAYEMQKLVAETNADFAAVTEVLHICVKVITPVNCGPFKKTSYFPNDAKLDEKMQVITVLDLASYPVLIPKRLLPLLDLSKNEDQLAADYTSFIYAKKKIAPSQIDPEILNSVVRHNAFNADLKRVTNALLGFSESLIGRFDKLIESKVVPPNYSSTAIGNSMATVWDTSKSVYKHLDEYITSADLQSIQNTFSGPSWGQFINVCQVQDCRQKREVFLECSHSLCEQHFDECIKAARESGEPVIRPDDPYTTVTCKCTNRVSVEVLKAYDCSLFERLVGESERQRGLQQCSSCNKGRPSSILFHLQCTHLICIHCANRSQFLSCPACSKTDEQLAGWMQSKFQCDSCMYPYAGSQACPTTCQDSHQLCPRCLLLSCKRARCVIDGCRLPLSEDNIKEMRRYAMGTCAKCFREKPSTLLLETTCDCIICLDCALESVRDSRQADNCCLCGHPLESAVSEELRRKAGIGTVQECFICETTTPPPEIKLVCKDSAHSDCLFRYALSFVEERKRVMCSCGIEVYFALIPDRWDPNPSSAAVADYLRVNRSYSVSCQRCNSGDVLELSPNIDTPSSAPCVIGRHEFCVLCQDDWDTNHVRGLCKVVANWTKILFLETKREVAVQCPYCKFAQKQKSEWQSCSECRQYFCSQCVARYDVISEHGQSYHREDCEYRSLELKEGGFGSNCSICQVVGGEAACKPPGRLARRGQFNPSELSQH